MSLKRHIYHLLALMERGDAVTSDVWEAAIAQCLAELEQTNSVSEIRMFLTVEISFDLPVPVSIAMHRRLVALERTPDHLRLLANCLYMYGPDWDDEAEDLRREADGMEAT